MIAGGKDTPCIPAPVICVDMDGTLVRCDTLRILFWLAVRERPEILFKCPLWLMKGKAMFKHELGKRASLEVKSLPYNEALIDYLRMQKARGRMLVLATASNRSVAQCVANHLGIFDEVIASDRWMNLRGEAKARRLIERFGEGGFTYAGNDETDVSVWKVAAAAIVVDVPARVRQKISVFIEFEIRTAGR